MHAFTPLIGLCALLAACGQSADTVPPASGSTPAAASVPAPAAAPTTEQAAPAASAKLLRLNTTVKDEPFKGAPACMVTFTIDNLHSKPLAVFSAGFKPTQASTGKALTTATEFAGISAGVAHLPLAPGATGNPWKQNVLGARCDDVALRFEGKFLCAFEGQPCTAGDIEAQQQGLASVGGLGDRR
jgi:hypothetical protein